MSNIVPKNSIAYTEEQLKIAIDMAVEGKSARKIIEVIHTTSHAFWTYRNENPIFAQKYQDARQEGLELLADDLIDITDRESDVNKARLISENTKWLLSKRKSKTYGDRLDVNINQTVDIGSALLDARARALPQLPKSASLIASNDTEHEEIVIEADDIFK